MNRVTLVHSGCTRSVTGSAACSSCLLTSGIQSLAPESVMAEMLLEESARHCEISSASYVLCA